MPERYDPLVRYMVYCCAFIVERERYYSYWLIMSALTLLELQSHFGDKPLKFQVVCPQSGTPVLKGLKEGKLRGRSRAWAACDDFDVCAPLLRIRSEEAGNPEAGVMGWVCICSMVHLQPHKSPPV